MIASVVQCNVILPILLILVPPSAFAFSEDYCSRSGYGQPNYEAYFPLLYGNKPVGKGMSNRDAFDQAYSLWYFAKPPDFTPAEWSDQVTLQCGVTISLSKQHLHCE